MRDRSEIPNAKGELRRSMREALRSMSDAECAQASEAACTRLAGLREFQDAASVMLYLPLPSELNCISLLQRSLHEGRVVCVPHVVWEARLMQPVRLTSLEDEALTVDRHGVRVPAALVGVDVATIHAVIVPGLAFDAQGGRLGRGGGFYDRFLSQVPQTTSVIGLAFERQIVAQVPRESHDAGVGVIVTESRVLLCH